ncbi:MAG: hypothetical protein ACRC2O_03125, partial [Chitinophagaceae bacterium]
MQIESGIIRIRPSPPMAGLGALCLWQLPAPSGFLINPGVISINSPAFSFLAHSHQPMYYYPEGRRASSVL